MEQENQKIINEVTSGKYKYGFVTGIETETVPKGLNEQIIRSISSKKNEPEFLLNFRLKSYRKWLSMKEPRWAKLEYPEINYQDIIYYAAPKKKQNDKSICN